MLGLMLGLMCFSTSVNHVGHEGEGDNEDSNQNAGDNNTSVVCCFWDRYNQAAVHQISVT